MGMSQTPWIIQDYVTFFLTVVLLLIALVGVAKIPKSAIRTRMIETAEYLSTKPATHFAVSGIRSSSIDWYADSLLLNIAYNLDDQNTLESVMWAPFSGYTNQHVSRYLLESARDGLEPTQEYLRYWHGSAVIVRSEHLFLNIRQIYFLHALIIAALCIWLLRPWYQVPWTKSVWYMNRIWTWIKDMILRHVGVWYQREGAVPIRRWCKYY